MADTVARPTAHDGVEVAGASTTGSTTGSTAQERGPRSLRWLGYGLLGGLLWGVAARAWMRFVSDNPEFSWTGTLFILGVAALAGVSLGALELLRRRGARLWRLVLVLPAVVMFASAGAPMLPSAVLGGLALSGRGPRWLRGAAAVLAVAPVVALVVLEDVTALPNSPALSLAGYLGLCAWLAVGWTAVWRRRVR